MSGRALTVVADLQAKRDDGRSLSLSGRGATLVVTADSLATFNDLRRDRVRVRHGGLFAAGIRGAGLAIEARVGRFLIARARPERRVPWRARLAGTAPFTPHIRGIIAAWWNA